MDDYTSLLLAQQRHREFIREVELDRLAKSVSGRQNQRRQEAFAAGKTHGSGKSDGVRPLVPVSVGSSK